MLANIVLTLYELLHIFRCFQNSATRAVGKSIIFHVMELLGLQLCITVTESTTNTILLYWCKLLLFVFQFCLLLLKILKPFLHSWVYTETLSEESLWFDALPKKSFVKNDYLSSYKKQFCKKLTLLMWVQKVAKETL